MDHQDCEGVKTLLFRFVNKLTECDGTLLCMLIEPLIPRLVYSHISVYETKSWKTS